MHYYSTEEEHPAWSNRERNKTDEKKQQAEVTATGRHPGSAILFMTLRGRGYSCCLDLIKTVNWESVGSVAALVSVCVTESSTVTNSAWHQETSRAALLSWMAGASCSSRCFHANVCSLFSSCPSLLRFVSLAP